MFLSSDWLLTDSLSGIESSSLDNSFHLCTTSLNVYRNINYNASCTVKENQSTNDILKYLSDLFQKTEFDISCKLSKETVCMKCQTLFSEKKSSNCCLSVVKVKLEIMSYSDYNLEQGLYKPINANYC